LYICIVRIYLKADSKEEAVKELYDIFGDIDYEIDEMLHLKTQTPSYIS